MTGNVVAESTGTLIHAVATQESMLIASRHAEATRYGIAYEVNGVADLSPRLFMSIAEAAAAANDYQPAAGARVVRVFVEVSDV